jgi:hypothetical protein
MPSRIRRIIWMGKANDESSEARPRNPTAHANNLVECGMQELVIHRLTEGLLSEIAETHHWSSPRSSIVWIKANRVPENLASFGRRLSWEYVLQFHEAITNELLPLRVAQKGNLLIGLISLSVHVRNLSYAANAARLNTRQVRVRASLSSTKRKRRNKSSS